jgi:uncharacterized membrane protein
MRGGGDDTAQGNATGGIRPGAPALSRPLVPRPRVSFVVALVIVAFALRMIAAIVLHQIVFAGGYNFFTRGDDQAYDSVAWQQAQSWRGVGPPVGASYTYLLNAYTYTQAGLFLLVGHRPFAMILLNCAFGALTAGLAYLIALRLFGQLAARFSAIAIAFFPSMLFWSLLNLKDVMSVLTIALLLWLATWLVMTGKQWLILPILLTLVIVGSVRVYIGGMLSVLIPVAVALQSRVRFPHKWRTAALLLAGGAMMLWLSGGGVWFVRTLPILGIMRFATAGDANSAYVPPLIAASPTPLVATGPAPAGDVRGAAVPTVAAAAGSVATAGASPPASDPDAIARRGSLRELVQWFPTGLAYALAAPFPWAARRAVELATIPEMLLWYASMILAVIGLGVHWRQWRQYVLLLGYLGGTILVMAVAEGTIGTLLRHRTMVILPTLIFSGAGAAWVWSHRPPHWIHSGSRSRKVVPPTLAD